MGLRPTQGDENRLPSMEAPPSPWSSLNPNNRSRMEAPPSPCHPEEPTCLCQVKGAMNSTGRRALDGCPMFAQLTWAEYEFFKCFHSRPERSNGSLAQIQPRP
jgi:hypothetical protein